VSEESLRSAIGRVVLMKGVHIGELLCMGGVCLLEVKTPKEMSANGRYPLKEMSAHRRCPPRRGVRIREVYT